MHATYHAHIILFDFVIIIFVVEHKLWSSSLCIFLQSPVTSSLLRLNIVISTMCSEVSIWEQYRFWPESRSTIILVHIWARSHRDVLEVELDTFLTSALEGAESQASHQNSHWRGVCVGSTAVLDAANKREILLPCKESNLDPSVVQTNWAAYVYSIKICIYSWYSYDMDW
jgi:hypothetical protein